MTLSSNINWTSFSEEKSLENTTIYVVKADVKQYFITIINNYHEILSEQELKKSLRYINQVDMERYICGKHLLRTLLSKFVPLSPSEIKFQTTNNKKPTIEGVEFNISHSGNYVLIAIGPSAVGVDVEHVNRTFVYETMLETSFCSEEINFINANNDALNAFYFLWTRKEALLKASGEGLTDAMSTFSCLDDIVERERILYKLYSFEIDKHHIASLAVSNEEQNIGLFSF